MPHYQHEAALGTLNVRTLKFPIKLHEIAVEASNNGLAEFAVQEHHLIGSGEIDLGENGSVKGWHFCYSGFAKSYGGVGLLYDSTKVKVVDEQAPIPGRLQIFRLKLLGLKVLWPIAYSPTDAQADSTKLKFYHDMRKVIKKAKAERYVWAPADGLWPAYQLSQLGC